MKKILVIEDNQEVRENLEEILELSGYQVDSAANGKLGVQKAMTNPPNIILCDIMMPELDGFGVLNILSKKSNTSHIPFIFLTAKSEKEDLRRGMNLGADDYITKPFYKDELLHVIEMRLKKTERLVIPEEEKAQKLSIFINEAKGLETLHKLSEEQKIRELQKKEILFSEGSYARYLFFVKKGKVKLFKVNDYGKEYIIRVCGPGDFFGFTALIVEEPYTFSAAAMENTEISLVPKDEFLELLHADRDVASRFIKMLSNNIAEKEEQLLHLAYDSIRKRVADTLLQISSKQQSEEIRILRDDLAQMVGTAKESVIRTLTEFKRDGILAIKEGVIHIKDKDQLERMPG